MNFITSLGWQQITNYIIAILGFGFNIILLILNYGEVKEIRKHQQALKKLEDQLIAVRPLYSTLYTSDDEIMKLAVDFVKHAQEIYSIGTINSLVHTEIKIREKDADFKKRYNTVDLITREYIAETYSYILSGRKYFRALNFLPVSNSDDEIQEILANVNFFHRILQSRASSIVELKLELFHNPEIPSGPGDFHFRSSDKQVVIRVGGASNKHVNSAIVITDTKVISQFQTYFLSFLNNEISRKIGADELVYLQKLLIQKEIEEISDYLLSLPKLTMENK
jgi:hypothetical protein